jgi:DNA-binding SARP family transcriptional activator/tetratricopeptide (TPR) repeat protein
MAITIRLSGTPSIEVDGVPAPAPRGRKSWAVLTFLILTERPPSRQRLAALLFDNANDPLGALRWSLAELRRALGGRDSLVGDPLVLRLPSETVIDVGALAGPGATGVSATEAAGELLEGMDFPGCDAFESWLLVERRRHAAAVEAMLHEAGLASLAAGQPCEAARIATTLVEHNSFEESHHVLLVRALAASGDRRAALEAATACNELFLRELGTEPSPAVRAAIEVTTGSPSVRALSGVAAARAQLEAGKAAISAGAVDAGLDCLRRCVDEARFADDKALIVNALTELGGALVHSVRGRDEEGASILHEAVERAARIRSPMAATAYRELGFVDVQAGRRERASVWLDRAWEHALARGDDAGLAAIAGVRGMNLSDQAKYPEALSALTDSVDRAVHCESRRQEAWSASLIGRLHFLRAEYEEAESALAQSLRLVKSERWLAFLPWPETFSAEVDVVNGRRKQAEQRLTEAFALACQLGDPCWEGMAARGIGLLQAQEDPGLALTRLSDARSRCIRWPDAYQWVHGYVLDAITSVAVAVDQPRAAMAADELLRLAARTDMRELVSRAELHRAALGVPGAQVAAQLAAADIDSPALDRLTRRPEHGT